MPARNFLVFGRADKPPEPLRLRAGPLTMLFEPQTAFLRRICLGQTEVVRSIYAAVRDRNWGTVPPRISNLRSQISEDTFRLTFGVECRQGEIDFHWRGLVTGAPDGFLTFSFDGEARSTFLRNRIGLCVLHPLGDCAGQPCEVVHTDGTVERGLFPQLISPHQPFKLIRALRHEVRLGLQVEVFFEGDVFEMEDQRNWTDASFKTYCTPLELPFPERVLNGTRIQQKVTVCLRDLLPEGTYSSPQHQRPFISPKSPLESNPLTPSLAPTEGEGAQKAGEGVVQGFNAQTLSGNFLSGRVASDKDAGENARPPAAVELELPAVPTQTLPPLGLGMASHGHALAQKEARRLGLLRLSHLRADLEFSKPGWPEALRRAVQAAGQIGCTLHLALFLTDEAKAELKALAAEMAVVQPPVSLWLVFHVPETATSEKWVRLARAALAKFEGNIPIATGTNANFAELNRHRPPPDSMALPCFPLNPQVHTIDTLSLVENLEAQVSTVETSRQFSPHRVVISPVTLRPRFNAVATNKATPAGADELPSPVDTRQMSLLAAAWTLGSIANLGATGHVHSLTYYETTGWRGVMETEAGPRVPEKFPSIPGAVFPVFFVLASLAGFTRIAPIATPVPQTIAALALFDGPRQRVLLANLTGQDQRVTLETPPTPVRRFVLDESNVELALREPEAFLASSHAEFDGPSDPTRLALRPHAFVCVDLG